MSPVMMDLSGVEYDYLTLVTWMPCFSAALQTAEPNRNTMEHKLP